MIVGTSTQRTRRERSVCPLRPQAKEKAMSASTMKTPSSSGVPATSGEADIAKHWIKNGMGHLLYRLDASIRVEGSHSRAIADIVERR
jgi:hypothetical protein